MPSGIYGHKSGIKTSNWKGGISYDIKELNFNLKKQIRISQNLKNLIEDFIKAQAKTTAMIKESEAMKAVVTQINQRENRVNIYWLFDDRGKIKKIFWNEGLSVKEKQELEEQNAWSLEQLAKNIGSKL